MKQAVAPDTRRHLRAAARRQLRDSQRYRELQGSGAAQDWLRREGDRLADHLAAEAARWEPSW